jgi:hypothetical protein
MAAMFLGLATLTTMSLGMQYHSVIWGIGLCLLCSVCCQYDHNQCVQRVDHLLVIHLSALRIDHTRDFYPSGAPTYFVASKQIHCDIHDYMHGIHVTDVSCSILALLHV